MWVMNGRAHGVYRLPGCRCGFIRSSQVAEKGPSVVLSSEPFLGEPNLPLELHVPCSGRATGCSRNETPGTRPVRSGRSRRDSHRLRAQASETWQSIDEVDPGQENSSDPNCTSGEGGWKRSRSRLTVIAFAYGQVNELRQKPRTSPAAHPTALRRQSVWDAPL